MATVETRLVREVRTIPATEATSEHDESLADRGLTLAAMIGAVGGAVGGAALGAGAGSAFPVFCGTMGTMFGSGLVAGVWWLLARLWTEAFLGYEAGHARDFAAAQQSAPSAPGAR